VHTCSCDGRYRWASKSSPKVSSSFLAYNADIVGIHTYIYIRIYTHIYIYNYMIICIYSVYIYIHIHVYTYIDIYITRGCNGIEPTKTLRQEMKGRKQTMTGPWFHNASASDVLKLWVSAVNIWWLMIIQGHTGFMGITMTHLRHSLSANQHNTSYKFTQYIIFPRNLISTKLTINQP